MLGSFPASSLENPLCRRKARAAAAAVGTFKDTPLEAGTADSTHLGRKSSEQRRANAAAAELVAHKQVFEVYSRRRAPRRVVCEVERHAHRSGGGGGGKGEEYPGVRWARARAAGGGTGGKEGFAQAVFRCAHRFRRLALVCCEGLYQAQDLRDVLGRSAGRIG